MGRLLVPSRKERDRVNKLVMNDPRLQDMDTKIFDGKRMFWGGFKPLVTLGE